MTLFSDKYRIESARLPGWNYAADGSYFLTICTYKSECIFGRILNGKMELSDFGAIVQEELLRSFEIRRELKCICFTIMPNHLHLIVNISQSGIGNHIEERNTGLKPKSISSFVGGLKSSATSRIISQSHARCNKIWQPRFHDHIIRDSKEFDFISNYIANNPATWAQDRFHQKNSGLPNIYPDN